MADKPIVGFTRDELTEMVRQILAEIPSSLPANGGSADYATNAGNANTVNGYNIRCEDVATPKYNWFATFDNDSLSGINPERAYVGNAGNAITANTVKTMSVIGTVSDVTHNSVLEWANSVNGFGTACLINAYGCPPDTPIQSEGFFTVETCYQNLRKYVTFKTFDGTKIYERAIWSGAWATEWREIYTSGDKPYVTGEVTGTSGSAIITTNHGFTPSAVFWWMISQGRALHSAHSFDTTSFTLSSSLTSDALVNYIIFR